MATMRVLNLGGDGERQRIPLEMNRSGMWESERDPCSTSMPYVKTSNSAETNSNVLRASRGPSGWVGSAVAIAAMLTLAAIGVGTSRDAQSSIPIEPAYSLLTSGGTRALTEDAPRAPTLLVREGASGSVLFAPMTPLASTANMRMYDGRPIRPVSTMRMKVTAYSPDARSCGASADGITASGYSVETNGGALVAADPKILPLGSLVSIPGYDDGAPVPVLDVGGAIKGRRIDVLFRTHEVARAWGVRSVDIVIWEYADGKPNGFKRLRR
ncbi:MAG: hypothetical protein EXS10_02645 [Phycisphaerales bacterium]|nr:hypothetical protein [Phycisphaerales bacterium]